ncbi:MAG: hypothetical protein KF729_38615, partial [Sandaracinaceae bacterium]|nr:hypothetical protein [Sandaracinaceae bacterium]
RRTERRAIDPDGDAPLTDRYRWSDAGTLTALERADGAEVRFVYDDIVRPTALSPVRYGGSVGLGTGRSPPPAER